MKTNYLLPFILALGGDPLGECFPRPKLKSEEDRVKEEQEKQRRLSAAEEKRKRKNERRQRLC